MKKLHSLWRSIVQGSFGKAILRFQLKNSIPV